jgi:hypothetical protein
MSQYITDMLDKYSMTDWSPSTLPMGHGFVSGIASSALTLFIGLALDVYPSLLDNLQYAAICSRPYIATALRILGFAEEYPSVQHSYDIKKVL